MRHFGIYLYFSVCLYIIIDKNLNTLKLQNKKKGNCFHYMVDNLLMISFVKSVVEEEPPISLVVCLPSAIVS